MPGVSKMLQHQCHVRPFGRVFQYYSSAMVGVNCEQMLLHQCHISYSVFITANIMTCFVVLLLTFIEPNQYKISVNARLTSRDSLYGLIRLA